MRATGGTERSFLGARAGASWLILLALGLPGCHEEQPPETAAPPDWLESQANYAGGTASSGQKGHRVGEILRGVAYRDDDREEWTVELDGRYCYWFSGAGDTTVKGLALYLWDPSHRRAGRTVGASEATLECCPRVSGPHRLQGKVTAGYGHFAVTVFKSGEDEEKPADVARKRTVQ